MKHSFLKKSVAMLVAAVLVTGNLTGAAISITASANTATVTAGTCDALQEAIDKAPDNTPTTIIVDGSDNTVMIDIPIHVSSNKVIVMELRDSLDRGLNYSEAQPQPDGCVIINNGDLTITDTGNGMSLTGGKSTGNGGGIYNTGTLTIRNTVDVTQCESLGNGGGIYNTGTIKLEGGTIEYNKAVNGAGIFNKGIITISPYSYENENEYGGTTTQNTQIENNTASEKGNGIYDEGTIAISGAPRFGMDNPVYLRGDTFLTVTGELKSLDYSGNDYENASISVEMEKPGTFTEGFGQYNKGKPDTYFSSADPDYGVTTTPEGEAILDENHWAELQEQINDIAESDSKTGTITLDRDYTAYNLRSSYVSEDASDLNVPEGTTITLDLNGHTIDRNLNDGDYSQGWSISNYSENGCVICNHGNLTIVDHSDSQTGTIKGGTAGFNASNAAGAIDNHGTLTIWGGTFTENRGAAGGIHNQSGATLNLYGGVITGNVSSNGFSAGVYNEGTLNVGETPVVRDNYLMSGTYDSDAGKTTYELVPSNIAGNVNSDDPFVINVDSPLSAGADMHVAYCSDAFTSGFRTYNAENEPSEFFKTDDDNASIVKDDRGEAKFAIKNIVTGTSLSLGEKIGVDFHITKLLSHSVLVNFSWGDPNNPQTYECYAEEKVSGKDRIATCLLAPKELGDTITYTVKLDKGYWDSDAQTYVENYEVVATGTYCVMDDYVPAILGDTNNQQYTQKDQQMVRAIVNYAAAAQMLFDYMDHPITPINDYSPSAGITSLDSFLNTNRVINKPQDLEEGDLKVSYYGSTLVLENDVILRHYFTIENYDETSLSFYTGYENYLNLNNPLEAVPSDKAENLYFVDCKVNTNWNGELDYGIAADRLTEKILFRIVYKKDSTETVVDFEYSPLDYIYIAMKSARSTNNTKAATKALYYYAQEALIYSGNASND